MRSRACSSPSAYFLTAALICHLHRQEIGSPALIAQIFHGEKTRRAFDALQSPAWIGPLSGLFVYAGHALGALLFGQYELAGVSLAFLLTVCSVAMVISRLRAIFGDKTAKDVSFLGRGIVLFRRFQRDRRRFVKRNRFPRPLRPPFIFRRLRLFLQGLQACVRPQVSFLPLLP